MYLSTDLWHSNKMKVILHKFAKHHCFLNSLNTELCWLYSFFLCWFFIVKPNNFKENFILKFPKNMINLHLCERGPMKSLQFICLPVCVWCIFLRIHSVDFPFFFLLHDDTLLCIIKSDTSRFWKIVFLL